MDAGQLVISFTAGALAALSPCALPLLPALIASRIEKERKLMESVMDSAGVSAGFLLVFALLGLVPSLLLGYSSQGNIWVQRVLGAVVALIGLARLATRVLDGLPSFSLGVDGLRGLPRSLAWGLGYGVASLGCSLPVFLLVVVNASATQAPLEAGLLFAAFGLGASAVLFPVIVGSVFAEELLRERVEVILPYVKTFGALLMVAAGTYLVLQTL